MVSFFRNSCNIFILLSIAIVDAQTINDFQYFLINLPTRLDSHISTVYEGKLYVFGGYLQSGTNYNFWSLDLAAFDFKLNENRDDIIAQGTANWVTITSNAILPDYGTGSSGSFICRTQCSVLIDNYLYIFKDNMYRVEITDDELIFANSTEINYTIPYTGACITTDGNDVYYMNSQFAMFNVSTQQHHLLTSMKYNRWSSACSFDRQNEKVYQFGGQSSSYNPLLAIDWYTISTGNWTDNEGNNNLGACGKCDWGWRCFQHPFYDLIECTDGWGGVIWNTSSNSRIYSTATQNRNYDLTLYHLNSDTVIVLTSGGWTGSTTVNHIRYAVIDVGVNPTVEPTTIPTTEPTRMSIDCTAYINTTYQLYFNNSCEDNNIMQFSDDFIDLITLLYSNNNMHTYSSMTSSDTLYLPNTTLSGNLSFTISTCFAGETNVIHVINYTTSYTYQHAINTHYSNCMSITIHDVVYTNTVINNTLYVTQFIEIDNMVFDTAYIWIIISCFIFVFVVSIFLVVKYKRYRQSVKSEREKNTIWIKNPMVLGIAIESYDNEQNLNGIANDVRNIYNLFELTLNYSIAPAYTLSDGLKLKWKQNEIMDFLVKKAKQLKDNLEKAVNNKYDGLVVFISAHGFEHNIIPSDGSEIQTDVFHRIFSSQHANIRTIPRIFIFDSCSGSKGKNKVSSVAKHDAGGIEKNVDDDNKENDIMNLEAFEEKYGAETWEIGEDNVDNLLIKITASNIGYQSKMNPRHGSYFIKEFCEAIEQNICNNNELFLGEIFSQVQSSLQKRGQLPEMKANNNTQFVKFASNKEHGNKQHEPAIEMKKINHNESEIVYEK